MQTGCWSNKLCKRERKRSMTLWQHLIQKFAFTWDVTFVGVNVAWSRRENAKIYATARVIRVTCVLDSGVSHRGQSERSPCSDRRLYFSSTSFATHAQLIPLRISDSSSSSRWLLFFLHNIFLILFAFLHTILFGSFMHDEIKHLIYTYRCMKYTH